MKPTSPVPESMKPETSQLELLKEQLLRQDAEIRAMRATMEALASRKPIEEPTLIPEEFQKWAGLSAQEKSQLVADKLFGPAEGTRPFEVQLVYRPKESATGQEIAARPSEHPRVKIHAHNDIEAKALYQQLCGITAYSPDMTSLEAVPA